MKVNSLKKKKKEFIWELKSGKTQVYFQIVYKQKEESEPALYVPPSASWPEVKLQR